MENDAPWIDIHPTETGGGTYPGKERNFIRCVQCGFPVDTATRSRGSGWGNNTYSDFDGRDKDSSAFQKDPPGVGCPLCGSSNYDGVVRSK